VLHERSSVWERGVLAIALIVVFIPIAYMVLIALTPHQYLFTRFIPPKLTLENFAVMLRTEQTMRTFLNSWIICLSAALLTVVLSSLAGYGLSRFRLKAQNLFIATILVTQMLPIEILVLSYFRILGDLKLHNTLSGLILVDCTLAIPFCTLMLKSLFDTFPKEIEEAALIDGCSRAGLFVRITLPLSRSGLFAAGIFSFLVCWSEYFFAVTLTTDYNAKPLTVEIAKLLGHYVTSWEKMMALAVLGSLPVLLLFSFTQKIFLRGMILGAVKE